jgi:transposase-like protein
MDQKTQFIADYLREVLNITELCELYGISRKTAYKWIDMALHVKRDERRSRAGV